MRSPRSPFHSWWLRTARVSLWLLAPLPFFFLFSSAHATESSAQIAGHKFDPATLSITAGTTVLWSNGDKDTHNVVIDQGPELFASTVLNPGDAVRFTFTRPGTYHYFCEWHPFMQADIVVTSPPGSAPAPQAPNSRLFSETGKAIRGKFLEYWQVNGGLAQQGYPISEEMQEKSETDGKFYVVQYFERAEFELHPENKPPYDVLLSLLGTFRYKQKYPNGAASASHSGERTNTGAGSILFPETGKRLGGKFLDYWRNGGLAQQGFPISDEFQEKSDLDGKTYTVQYFERAEFELHPENKPPYDVLLSQLGKFRYQARIAAGVKPTSGIYSTGISSGPQHYPLLAGPHAAPGVNAWI